MKKVYMPTTEELYIMQDKGINLYKYILIKAIESIIMDTKVYKNTSILDNIYKYLREDPYISTSICRMYPEEIASSNYARDDISLCLQLISQNYNQDKSIYNLDNLSYFENGIGVLTNVPVVENTIKTLIEKLPDTPKYRFEYKPNTLLDDIFNCQLNTMFLNIPIIEIAKIDPAYILKYKDEEWNNLFRLSTTKQYILNELVNTYAKRYGISQFDCNEYDNHDILTNPDTNVKRLLKCINQRKIK